MAQEPGRQIQFDFGPLPVLTPAPGDSFDVVEGYYLLEQAERGAMRAALARFPEPVTLWYGFLTSTRRALEGQHERSAEYANITRRELMTLGLSSSKAALDALLAGYYSIAFASIRHITECWCFSRYLVCHPEKHAAFYAPEPGKKKVKFPTDTDGIFKDVKTCNHPHAQAATVDNLRNLWIGMHTGAHVTARGLIQAMANEHGVYHLGATYVPGLALMGFQSGLFASYYLMRETLCLMAFDSDEAVSVVQSQSQALDKVMDDLSAQISALGPENDD